MAKLILASASLSRIALLKNAGIDFTSIPARIDERAIEAPMAACGKSPAEIAMALAEAKALSAANGEPDAFVIGADQILAADGRRWNKPASIAEARDQLMTLSGRVHELHSAIAVARGGTVAWRHGEAARMTMRRLPADLVNAYLTRSARRSCRASEATRSKGLGSSCSSGSRVTISPSSACRFCRCLAISAAPG